MPIKAIKLRAHKVRISSTFLTILAAATKESAAFNVFLIFEISLYLF